MRILPLDTAHAQSPCLQEARHVPGLEDIGEQAIALLEIEPVLKARRDAGSILARGAEAWRGFRR